jgi:hypothetical protein
MVSGDAVLRCQKIDIATMQVFKIRPEGLKEIRKQVLVRVLPVMLIAVAAGIAISFINIKDKAQDINVLPFLIPFMAAMVGFGLYRGVKRQETLLASYTLTITSNLITREQWNTPAIAIYLNDIREISKHRNGSFTIKGKEPADLIVIPAQIDNYAQLESTLQQLQPLNVTDPGSFVQKNPYLTGLLNLGLMFCVYTTSNKIMVAITGTAFVTLMVLSFMNIQRSKNVDHTTRRSLWWSVLLLISVIAVMIFKLTGLVDMQQ